MHWHILGAGAIGCTWAAQLCKSNHDVTLILRTKERLQQLSKSQGIIYQATNGEACTYNVGAELTKSKAPIKNLLICTKAYSTISALQSVADRLSSDANVVLLQNGLGPQQEAVKLFSELSIWAATTTDGAYLNAPYHVIRAGHGETLIGAISNKAQQSLDNIIPAPCGDLKIYMSADITHKLWCKVAINAAINPLTALNNCKNGMLVSNAVLSMKMQNICEEVEKIATACGQNLFDKPLYEMAKSIASTTAENYSSMLQDIKQNRPTEIEEITGFLCQQADKFGCHAPENRMLLQQIKQLSSAIPLT
ncbi:ketopantoate reductase family protein [Neptunomonas japonica]|uniref:2-dehydropantoate 2-reductase n=1 Tax=Neptunomonas japonica JAMM 1380 TaxID=1441457 RepID=A0A7R6PKB1_9GAMM|nr:2-dehydropantoate 2-reductase [Neptunomonas japonica]BBB30681.1 2-dehydropantoate 2-reductase [Neptunomonas japonica JAMM 1380]